MARPYRWCLSGKCSVALTPRSSAMRSSTVCRSSSPLTNISKVNCSIAAGGLRSPGTKRHVRFERFASGWGLCGFIQTLRYTFAKTASTVSEISTRALFTAGTRLLAHPRFRRNLIDTISPTVHQLEEKDEPRRHPQRRPTAYQGSLRRPRPLMLVASSRNSCPDIEPGGARCLNRTRSRPALRRTKM